MSMVERHAAAIRRNLAIPGGGFAAQQIFAEFVHVHGGDPDELLQALGPGHQHAAEHDDTRSNHTGEAR